ncbi:MAG: phytanoyl-CoA dioxygenase family protein, partial [Rhodobacteraceae bacterium]|nr:phytanoyl-CoA dioxygenase family protein [Paracoccaceae bacterium]
MNIPLANGRLGRAAVERYWEDGYLHPIRAISPAQAAEWRAELEAIERDWLDAGLPLPLNTYKRVNANCVMPLAHRIATHPAILDVVEGVLGPDLLIYGVEFFIKEPRTKHRVSMHQDLTYWGLGAIDGMVTMWLA